MATELRRQTGSGIKETCQEERNVATELRAGLWIWDWELVSRGNSKPFSKQEFKISGGCSKELDARMRAQKRASISGIWRKLGYESRNTSDERVRSLMSNLRGQAAPILLR